MPSSVCSRAALIPVASLVAFLGLMASPGCPPWPRPADAAEHAVLLQYHHVADETPASTSTRPDLFAAHLEFLAAGGFHVASLGAVLVAWQEGRALPDSTVCLTFDDAWSSVAATAWPLVTARGWTLTLFVGTGEVDEGGPGRLGWPDLRELAQAGMTFGPHGIGHEHLARPRPGETAAQRRDRLTREVAGSLDRLRRELGDAAVLPVFAYPYGEFDPVLQDVVRSLGLAAVGQHSGAAWSGGDRTALPRFPMGGVHGGLDDFGLKVSSLPLPVTLVEPASMMVPAGLERPRLRLCLEPGAWDRARLAAWCEGQPAPVAWDPEPAACLTITTPVDLPPGRSRTNITAPSRTERRWYWYSHPWLRLPPESP